MARILIVENDPQNMRAAVLLLENAGHDVLQANDARVGINLARAYQPELILMGMQLPGVGGLAASRSVKDDSSIRDCKIYALVLDMQSARQDILAAGCDGAITKPIRSGEFLKMISEALTY